MHTNVPGWWDVPGAGEVKDAAVKMEEYRDSGGEWLTFAPHNWI